MMVHGLNKRLFRSAGTASQLTSENVRSIDNRKNTTPTILTAKKTAKLMYISFVKALPVLKEFLISSNMPIINHCLVYATSKFTKILKKGVSFVFPHFYQYKTK